MATGWRRSASVARVEENGGSSQDRQCRACHAKHGFRWAQSRRLTVELEGEGFGEAFDPDLSAPSFHCAIDPAMKPQTREAGPREQADACCRGEEGVVEQPVGGVGVEGGVDAEGVLGDVRHDEPAHARVHDGPSIDRHANGRERRVEQLVEERADIGRMARGAARRGLAAGDHGRIGADARHDDEPSAVTGGDVDLAAAPAFERGEEVIDAARHAEGAGEEILGAEGNVVDGDAARDGEVEAGVDRAVAAEDDQGVGCGFGHGFPHASEPHLVPAGHQACRELFRGGGGDSGPRVRVVEQQDVHARPRSSYATGMVDVLRGIGVGFAVLWLGGSVGLAQSSEYKLNESREWSAVKAPEPGTDEALIMQARKHLAEDQPAPAQKMLAPWIEEHRRAGHPLLAEALLIRGDALLAQDREFDALYDYEEVCKGHRESEAFATAVERELDIAVRYANGLRLRVFGFRWGDPEDVLVELLLRVSERLPRSQAAERAMIELADYYYRQRELGQAKDVYDAYLESFPTGPNALKAHERRIHCDVGRFKGPRYNAAALIDAKVQIEQFQRRYPAQAEATGLNASLASRLDESMAAQLLDTAKWYLRVDDEASAKFVLERLQRDHPLTLSAERGRETMRAKGWGGENSGQGTGDSGQQGESSDAAAESNAP